MADDKKDRRDRRAGDEEREIRSFAERNGISIDEARDLFAQFGATTSSRSMSRSA